MYNSKTLSIVMPAYNEAESIARVVQSYKELPIVDQVIVIDNNSVDETGAYARRAGAQVIVETKQGYGHASRAALRAADTDLVIIVESDSTFRALDVYKFLAYSEEFDCVFGTRTSKTCIWSGANMGAFLRYGNCAVAKLLEYLHNGPCLTDVGCTFKLFRRDALQKIEGHLTAGGSTFSPQLMYVAIRCGLRCVEIPVNYRARVGESKITGDLKKAFFLGLRMIRMIVAARFSAFVNVGTCVSPAVIAELEGSSNSLNLPLAGDDLSLESGSEERP